MEVINTVLFILAIGWVAKSIYHDIKGETNKSIHSLVWGVWCLISYKLL